MYFEKVKSRDGTNYICVMYVFVHVHTTNTADSFWGGGLVLKKGERERVSFNASAIPNAGKWRLMLQSGDCEL